MAFKVLGVLGNEPQSNPAEQQSLGYGGSILQGGKEGLAGLLGIPGSLIQAAFEGQRESIRKQSPEYQRAFTERNGPIDNKSYAENIPSSSQLIEKTRGDNHQSPQGFGERFAYNTGAVIPAVAAQLLSGGAALPIAVRAAGGALGETIGENFGPLGGLIGGILGGYGANKGANALLRNERISNVIGQYGIKPYDITGTATEAQKKAYDLEKELGKKVSGPSASFDKKLERYQDKIREHSGMPSLVKKDLVKRAQEVRGVAKEHIINGGNLSEKKREVGQLYDHYKGPQYKNVRNSIDQLQKIIFEEGDVLGKNNPEWLNAWKSGDDITKVLKYGESLKRITEDVPTFLGQIKTILRNPISKFIGYGVGLGGGAYTGYLPAATAGVAALEGGRQGLNQAKYLTKFMEFPSTQKLLSDAAKQTVHGQVPQLLRTYNKLNSSADKYSKENPDVLSEVNALQEKPKQKGFKVLGVVE